MILLLYFNTDKNFPFIRFFEEITHRILRIFIVVRFISKNSAGSGYELHTNPQHFTVSEFVTPIMYEFIMTLLAKYHWTDIAGLADLSSVDLSYMNRAMRTTLLFGVDTQTPPDKTIRYNDFPFDAKKGTMEMEGVLRKMSQVSRSEKLFSSFFLSSCYLQKYWSLRLVS